MVQIINHLCKQQLNNLLVKAEQWLSFMPYERGKRLKIIQHLFQMRFSPYKVKVDERSSLYGHKVQLEKTDNNSQISPSQQLVRNRINDGRSEKNQ